MPYKNPKDKKKQSQKYYLEHKKERKAYAQKNRKKINKWRREYLRTHPEKKPKYTKKVKEYRQRYEEEHREERKAMRAKRRKKLQKLVNEYKLSKGCSICGYNEHAEALDFHHTTEKEFTIGQACNRTMSLERIKKEMEKCTILCANCHRIEHKKNKGEKK